MATNHSGPPGGVGEAAANILSNTERNQEDDLQNLAKIVEPGAQPLTTEPIVG